MKKKSGRAKRLKVLTETLRLKEQNAQMENYIKVQTARMKAMIEQYSRENAVTNILQETADENREQIEAVEQEAQAVSQEPDEAKSEAPAC